MAVGAFALAALIPVFVPGLEIRLESTPTTVDVQVHQVCAGEGTVCRFER